MNLFKRYYLIAENKEPLLEDIYSGKAIVYHRTNQTDLIKLIFKEGYKPKPTSNYGMGMYATYDLKTQKNSDFGMKYMYGPIIVKIMINSIDNFLILDYSEFIKTNLFKKLKSTKKTFIIDQLKYFNFDFIQPVEDFQYTKTKYSSEIFDKISFYFGGEFKIKRFIDGVFFTSEDEGKNVVSYNTNIIIPLSFSLDEGKTWIKEKKDKNYLKKVFSQYTDDIKIKYKKDSKIKHWIKDAKISDDAKFEVNDLENYDIKYNNKIYWINGTWYEGTWYDGYWQDGTWKKGTWKTGTWNKGLWEFGTWEHGNFLGGVWLDGTWKDGEWKGVNKLKDIWKDGIWEKGIWWNGTWEKGTWKKGDWQKGDWLDGTWESGFWYGGTWKGGIWLGGYDKYHKYHEKGDSPNKWNL